VSENDGGSRSPVRVNEPLALLAIFYRLQLPQWHIIVSGGFSAYPDICK
jgi:hypothetical protein